MSDMFRHCSGKRILLLMQEATRHRFDTWLARSPGIGNGNSVQYSSLENSIDREAWWATVHGATKSQTWLSTFTRKYRLKQLRFYYIILVIGMSDVFHLEYLWLLER